MSSRIDDFIGQGLLPFAGREEEMEKILAFWRSVPEAQRLRVMLLTAEAGMGKSRLLEECLPVIRAGRGAVIHVKLYPEAANSLAALTARSLWASPSGRMILRSRPGENLLEVTAALQRLCRLRPTLLVLEDIHLFPSESIPDLVRLFESLVDETISVLCLSRPATFAAQGVLERYLVESVTMDGLRPAGLAGLWNELFGFVPQAEVIERLFATTRGNCLAVRSGLRGAVQNGSLTQDARTGRWRLSEPIAPFEQALRRSVSLVAEGMVAHLDKEKREVVERLAALGEVFARETAIGLDERAGSLLDELVEQGILVETVHPVAPLAGLPVRESGRPFVFTFPQSEAPLLAFTHSLLHDYLAARRRTDASALLNIIAGDFPLYSLVPLRLLETLSLPAVPDMPATGLVLRRYLAVAQWLDKTAQWRDGVELFGPLNRLLEYLEKSGEVTEEEKLLRQVQIRHASLSVMRRSLRTPEWRALHDLQMEATRNPATYEMVQYGMLAWSYELWRVGVDRDYAAARNVLEEVEGIVAGYPEIGRDIAYIYVLESIVEKASSHGDYELLAVVNGKARALLADPELPGGTRQALVERILHNLLHFYETPEELREREESIALIEEYRPQEDPYYGVGKVQFLVRTGRLRQAVTLSEEVSGNAREHGLWLTAMSVQEWRIIGCAGIGIAPVDLLRETLALLALGRQEGEEHEKMRTNPEAAFALVALLTGGIDEVERLPADTGGVLRVSLPFLSLFDLWRGDPEAFRRIDGREIFVTGYPARRVVDAWKRAAAVPAAEGADRREEVLSLLLPLSDCPVLDLFDMLTPCGTFHLWRGLFGQSPEGELKEGLIRDAHSRLAWLAERSIPGYMGPLIRLLEELGQKEEGERWRKRMKEEEGEQVRSISLPADAKIRISMLGAVRVAIPPEDFAPIRGVRIRTLLGLMVADRMIPTPLSGEEFLALAGGEESDPEHARKKKNMAVVRLREIIGHDAVLTDGPTPQLNPDVVAVDLLEIDDLIRRALEAARYDAFVRALPLIEEGLERYRGEVPFPTLYENFFEAARNDFEHRLRRAVLEIGHGMIAMGDAAGAEPFLRRAFDALPGDEEIADLLRKGLEAAGSRIEAERIRMRAEQL